ncbi:uncharacterized protein LOC134783447 [Penaeus indicus]|uniref:uncharacterized protein LOC134783447 n=1 Tax=Penaeus indicus TaxID=29960 RepID=UPI00300CB923
MEYPQNYTKQYQFNAFHGLITDTWDQEDLPNEFRDATVVPLSTTDMVFTVRQVQEKCIEQNLDFYAVFIDLTKAFHTVDRALWVILARLGCPRKFTYMIRLFHDGMTGTVLSSGEYSESFSITNGVKQDCVLAPVLFNLFFSSLLEHATKNIDRGIYLKYRLDGSLFNLMRLNAKTKTRERLLVEALFADDCALMVHTEEDLQFIVDQFSQAARLFGLTISLPKTEVLYQSTTATPTATLVEALFADDCALMAHTEEDLQFIVDQFSQAARLFGLTISLPKTEVLYQSTTATLPNITIEGTQLKTVEDFKYLGSVIGNDGSFDKEINSRISKASQALGRLKIRILSQHSIKLSTKLQIYQAIVLTSLLYGCLNSILGIRWQDRVSNIQVLERANSTSIEDMILKSQLRWTGHIIRMNENCIPRQILYGAMAQGRREHGRPRKRYKDCEKVHLSHAGLAPEHLEEAAQDRVKWRSLIGLAKDTFEMSRTEHQLELRDKRKTAAAAGPGQFPCHHCERICRSRIGLHSHLRVHNR